MTKKLKNWANDKNHWILNRIRIKNKKLMKNDRNFVCFLYTNSII